MLKRQLCDVIGDGLFAGEIRKEVTAILLRCPMFKLTGDLGDLDYDIEKRRHVSLHLRSSQNKWKHNKTGYWIRKRKMWGNSSSISGPKRRQKAETLQSRRRKRDEEDNNGNTERK